MGIFHAFVADADVELVGVEAAGEGLDTGRHSASLTQRARPGVLHGSLSYLLQDEHGQVHPAHSISAGLDYPGRRARARVPQGHRPRDVRRGHRRARRCAGFAAAQPARRDHSRARDGARRRLDRRAARTLARRRRTCCSASAAGATRTSRRSAERGSLACEHADAAGSRHARSSAEPPFPPALVEEMLKAPRQGDSRAPALPPEQPVYQRALENLRARVRCPSGRRPTRSSLAITETEFRWEGRVVMHEATKCRQPAVGVLQGRRSRAASHAGLRGARRSWSCSTSCSACGRRRRTRTTCSRCSGRRTSRFFAIATSISTLEDKHPIEATVPAERPTQIPPPQQVEPRARSAPRRRAASRTSTRRCTSSTRTRSSTSARRSRKEYESDLRRNVLAILLDIFELQSAKAVRDEISDILENFLMHLLSAGQFATVAYLMRESQEMVTRARELDAAQRTKLVGLPDRLSAAGPLSQPAPGAWTKRRRADADRAQRAVRAASRRRARDAVRVARQARSTPRCAPLLENAAARLASAEHRGARAS